MLLDHINQIVTWLSATNIDTLELRGPSQHLRLERRDGGFTLSDTAPVANVSTSRGRSDHTLRADTPGIFLHRHPLHEVALTNPGGLVEPGDTLGLLQIGPVLVPVRAPRRGRVEGVWVAHRTPVGFGAALVELEQTQE